MPLGASCSTVGSAAFRVGRACFRAFLTTAFRAGAFFFAAFRAGLRFANRLFDTDRFGDFALRLGPEAFAALRFFLAFFVAMDRPFR